MLSGIMASAADRTAMFSNPVIFADCPDMDIIRVDDNYCYFFTTTDIEHGRWVRSVVPMCYDPGLLFDDNGTETLGGYAGFDYFHATSSITANVENK